MFVLIGSMAACVTAPPAPTRTVPVHRTGEHPEIGIRSETSVGGTIYEIYNYKERAVTRSTLDEPIRIDVLLASAALFPGTPLELASEQGSAVFCTVGPRLRVAGQENYSHICLRDSDGDGVFESWRSPDGPPARQGWAELKTPAAFSQSARATEMQEKSDGFRYELLYQGISSGVISILYREYLDSLVRPAFQQDLSYTLEPEGDTQISFRQIRISVHSADNNGIEFTVERGLEL